MATKQLVCLDFCHGMSLFSSLVTIGRLLMFLLNAQYMELVYCLALSYREIGYIGPAIVCDIFAIKLKETTQFKSASDSC